MPLPPFSWIGLECILHYMEPNKRFETAQHCAAIQKAEKRVPLRIDFLQLEDLDITIDESKYRLDVHRKCDHLTTCDSRAPYVLRNDLEIRNDLDQYCLPISPTDLGITPGDLIFDTQLPNFHNDRRKIIAARQNQLSTMKLNLQGYIKRSSQGIFQPSFTKNFVSEFRAKIKKLEEDLEDFHLQREVVRNPCHKLLQLTIFKYKHNYNRLVQQGVYNMKLGKAMKQLTNFLFSGRRHPIQVKRLKILETIKVLRLPDDMKLHVKELDIEGDPNKFCRVIQPILTEDSSPLELVKVTLREGQHFTRHEMIIRAKKIQICCEYFPNHDIFSELECLEFEMRERFFDAPQYFHIVLEWLNTQKRLGTRYTFYDSDDNRRILDEMRIHFHGFFTSTGSVAIPMRDDSGAKIHISCEMDDVHAESKLVFEVVAGEI